MIFKKKKSLSLFTILYTVSYILLIDNCYRLVTCSWHSLFLLSQTDGASFRKAKEWMETFNFFLWLHTEISACNWGWLCGGLMPVCETTHLKMLFNAHMLNVLFPVFHLFPHVINGKTIKFKSEQKNGKCILVTWIPQRSNVIALETLPLLFFFFCGKCSLDINLAPWMRRWLILTMQILKSTRSVQSCTK